MSQSPIDDQMALIRDAEAAIARREPWTQNEFAPVKKLAQIVELYLKDIAEPNWNTVLIRLPAGFPEASYLGLADMMHYRGYSATINDPKDPYRPVVEFPYYAIQITR